MFLKLKPEPGPNPNPTRKARPDLQLCSGGEVPSRRGLIQGFGA